MLLHLLAALAVCCEVTGVVRDDAGRPLAGVVVAAEDGHGSVVTGRDGTFRMVLGGRHVLSFSQAGRVSLTREVEVEAALQLEVTLAAVPHVREEVVVQAIHADASVPVTKTDLDRATIQRGN